jgi:hypothetical protein
MEDRVLAVVSPSIRPFACSTCQSLTNVRSGHGIFEDPIPLRKDEVGSDYHTAALAAIGQHCETYSGCGCPCQFFSGTYIYWLLLYIKNQSESILWDIITEESPKTTFFTIKLIYLTPIPSWSLEGPLRLFSHQIVWLYTLIKKLDGGTASLRARFLIYMNQNEGKPFLEYCDRTNNFIETYACFISVWDQTGKFHIITSI